MDMPSIFRRYAAYFLRYDFINCLQLKRLQQMYHLSQVAKRNTTQRPSSIEGPPKPQVLKKPRMAITPGVENEKMGPAAKKEGQKDSKGKGDSDASKKKHDGQVESPSKKGQGKFEDGETSRTQQARPPKNIPTAKKDGLDSPNGKGKDAGPSKAGAKKEIPKGKDGTRNQGKKDGGVKEQASKGQVEKKRVRFTPSTSS